MERLSRGIPAADAILVIEESGDASSSLHLRVTKSRLSAHERRRLDLDIDQGSADHERRRDRRSSMTDAPA